MPADRVSELLEKLSLPGLGRILDEVEIEIGETRTAVTEQRLMDARLASAAGNVSKVELKVAEILRDSPASIDALRHEPAFLRIRIEVEAAIRAVVSEFRAKAERSLAEASKTVETEGAAPVPGCGADTSVLLAVAMRYFEVGRLPDLARAHRLAERVSAIHRAGQRQWPFRALVRGQEGAGRIWARAPLLVLLILWLIPGLFGWVPQWLWAAGLLGLVGCGFIARVRRVRF